LYTFVHKVRNIMTASYQKIKPKMPVNVSGIVTIHYYEFGPNFVFPGELHDFWEMVYIDKGTVEISRDNEQFTARQGDVVFHRPNEFHAIRALDSSPNFFVISFVCSGSSMHAFEGYRTQLDKTVKGYVSSIITEAEHTYIIPKNDPSLKKLIRKKDAPLGGEQLIKTYLEQIMIYLLRNMTQKRATASLPKKNGSENSLIAEIQNYLSERVEQTVRIEDICQAFGYSRSFLSRLFLSETGETIAAYATKRKIDRAKQLIRETDMNFSQISTVLAFENPQYFSRVFKRCTGMTPTEFKNRAHV